MPSPSLINPSMPEPTTRQTTAFGFFRICDEAIRKGVAIESAGARDKEFHFQNWVKARLADAAMEIIESGRNSYPDFPLKNFEEGYEVKGLEYPGRDDTYDSNSQVPRGMTKGRTVFYVFGRYPKERGKTYPVLDLVVCHGDFLNADHKYVHENTNLKGFGSYGDIMIRDRKMYVPRTPYSLASGLDGAVTLIVPEAFNPPHDFLRVGTLAREVCETELIGYEADLLERTLLPRTRAREDSQTAHVFAAYRLKESGEKVLLNIKKVVDTGDRPDDSSEIDALCPEPDTPAEKQAAPSLKKAPTKKGSARPRPSR